jgi:hypothetical protein
VRHVLDYLPGQHRLARLNQYLKIIIYVIHYEWIIIPADNDVYSSGRIIIVVASSLDAICNPRVGEGSVAQRTWAGPVGLQIAIRQIDQIRFVGRVGIPEHSQATLLNRGHRRTRSRDCRVNETINAVGGQRISNRGSAGRASGNAKSTLPQARTQA